MGEGMKQSRPAGGAAAFPAWRHVAGWQKFRFRRAGGAVRWSLPADLSDCASSPILSETAGECDLFGRVRRGEDGDGGGAESHRRP